MGSSSGSAHRGLVHWQRLLLVASLLNFWIQFTTAQVTVDSIDALKGTDVTLFIHHYAPKVTEYLWYRGENTDFFKNIANLVIDDKGHERGSQDKRVRVENDGSLSLKNVSMEDSGIYTVVVQLQGCQKMVACGRLDVYPVVSVPILVVSNTAVTENKDSVHFTCFTDADIITWFFNGSSLRYTQQMKLSHDRKSLSIRPVKKWDAGEYHCVGSNVMSSAESNTIKLEVKSEYFSVPFP